MQRKTVLLPAVVVALTLAQLTSSFAQAPKPVTLASLALIDTAFTTHLNLVVRGLLPPAKKETTAVNEKVWKDVVDKTVYKTKDSKPLPHLKPEQAQELRELIQRRIDNVYLHNEAPGNLAAIGKLKKDIFVQKIGPVATK